MNSAMRLNHWSLKFDDLAAGSERTFRSILSAMENPGSLVTIYEKPPAPQELHSASAATCLTLLENEAPVWTDIDWKSPVISWLQWGCGSCVVTEPSMANFALVTKPASMPALDYFRVGRNEYPDTATTLVVQVDDILPGSETKFPILLTNGHPQLELKGVLDQFWHQWQQVSSLYPMGIDIFVTCEDVLAAVPKIN